MSAYPKQNLFTKYREHTLESKHIGSYNLLILSTKFLRCKQCRVDEHIPEKIKREICRLNSTCNINHNLLVPVLLSFYYKKLHVTKKVHHLRAFLYTLVNYFILFRNEYNFFY